MKTKTIVLLLFFQVWYTSFSQKIALIDRNFKTPMLFTDSLTVNQVSNNYFPAQVSDLDSLIANLEFIKGQLNDIQRSKLKSYTLKSGKTQISILTIPHAYGDAYDITMTTTSNNIIADFLISSNLDLNKKATKKINKFIEYIKKDKDINIRQFKEFNPVILDATIFIRSNN